MNEVIGPIDSNTWYTMRQVYSSIRYMQKCNARMYAEAIRKEMDIYKELKNQYVSH